MSKVPFLSRPLTLGDLTLRNRNVMASLTRNRNLPTNVPNDVVKEYYAQRARGGASLILTEGTLISQQGTEWPHAPGIWNEEQVAAWKKVTGAVHEAGSYIFCQVRCIATRLHSELRTDIDIAYSSGTLAVLPTLICLSRRPPER